MSDRPVETNRVRWHNCQVMADTARVAHNRSVARRRFSRRLLLRIIPFALIAAAAGVPLSYQIQSDLVRGMVSRRDYTTRVFSVAPNAVWDQIRAEGGSADPLGIV